MIIIPGNNAIAVAINHTYYSIPSGVCEINTHHTRRPCRTPPSPLMKSGERGRDFQNASGIEMSVYFRDTGMMAHQ